MDTEIYGLSREQFESEEAYEEALSLAENLAENGIYRRDQVRDLGIHAVRHCPGGFRFL